MLSRFELGITLSLAAGALWIAALALAWTWEPALVLVVAGAFVHFLLLPVVVAKRCTDSLDVAITVAGLQLLAAPILGGGLAILGYTVSPLVPILFAVVEPAFVIWFVAGDLRVTDDPPLTRP